MKFESMEEPAQLDGAGPYGIFVRIYPGPETVLTVGKSATRRMLSILAPSGYANITYEQALSLKAWLNENIG